MNKSDYQKTIDIFEPDVLMEARIKKSIMNHNFTKKHYHVKLRFSTCVLAALLILITSFGTAMAVSAEFRTAVISFFYPLYTDEKLVTVKEGHYTGGFDEYNVLFEFLQKFEDEKLSGGIAIKKDTGYDFTIDETNEDAHTATVFCLDARYQLIVNLERKPYEETTGLWQVISYKILENLNNKQHK